QAEDGIRDYKVTGVQTCALPIFGRFNLVSTLIYVMMGWIGLIAIKPFLAAIPSGALLWLMAGGIAYTGGVVFYLWERLRFSHARSEERRVGKEGRSVWGRRQ